MSLINQLLDFTPETYEDMIWDTYFEWCMDFVTDYERELQSILANKAINSYFRQEYDKLEKEFLNRADMYKGYHSITSDDYRNLYAKCTATIFSRFPKPLLAKAKKTCITSN